jgi:hypothetical protein
VAYEGREPRERDVEAAPDDARDSIDAPVNQPVNGAHRASDDRPTQPERGARDRLVKGLDQAGDSHGRIDRETARAAHVGQTVPYRVSHGARQNPIPEPKRRVSFTATTSRYQPVWWRSIASRTWAASVSRSS